MFRVIPHYPPLVLPPIQTGPWISLGSSFQTLVLFILMLFSVADPGNILTTQVDPSDTIIDFLSLNLN